MSQDFSEGGLTFSFPDSWSICRPEKTAFYDRHFKQFCGGCKAVDFLAYDPGGGELWLIEVKDYRVNLRTKPMGLADEVALKTRDVLAMLVVAPVRDEGLTGEVLQVRDFCARLEELARLRIVLHCELPASPSKLFPGVKDSANLQDKLRQKLRCVDPHSLFTNRTLTRELPWTVV